jgi:threonine dehydrogenase-like Zn-dependent dehydrogenase
VRTAGVGVCAGDIFSYKQFRREPEDRELWLGHEASGTVPQVGEQVREFAPRDRVTVLGGAFAEYCVADEAQLARVPQDVDLRSALGEPVACCIHAGWRFGIRLGHRVAVIGAGFMGLVCAQLARLQGAGHLAVLDVLPWRLPMAEELGADCTFDLSDMSPQRVAEELGQCDVVIEAAGTQSALDLATPLVRQHGRLVLVGYHQSNDGMRTVDMKKWNFKAIDVVHGHVRRAGEKRDAMAAGMRLISSGRLQVEPLVTCYPLSDIQRAFDDLVARKEGLFKAVVVPGAT